MNYKGKPIDFNLSRLRSPKLWKAMSLAKPYEIRSEKFSVQRQSVIHVKLLWVSPGYRAAVLADPDGAANSQ